MKNKKTRLILMGAILSLLFSTVAMAYNMHFKQSITLTASQSSVSSSQYGGHYGRGTLTNNAGSAGYAKLELMSSSGSGWHKLTTIYAAAGKSDSTAVWGRSDTDYLFKIIIRPLVVPDEGYPGVIAYGNIYTGID